MVGNWERASCAATIYVVDLSESRSVRLGGVGLGVVGEVLPSFSAWAGDETEVPMR